MTDSDFDGKVAVVTGGGSGIGAASALLLAERGAQVLVVGLDKSATQLMADEIGDAARAFTADVSRPDDCEAMVAEAMRIFGRLDVAVNSAGIRGPNCRTADYPLDGWADVVAVNLSGVFYCMRAEIPMMVSSGGGAIGGALRHGGCALLVCGNQALVAVLIDGLDADYHVVD